MCGDYLIEVPPCPARKACWTHFTEVETEVQRGQVHDGGPHSREHRVLIPERGSMESDLGSGGGSERKREREGAEWEGGRGSCEGAGRKGASGRPQSPA